MPPKVGRRPAAKAKAAVRVLVGARPKVRAARPKIRARPGALRRPAAGPPGKHTGAVLPDPNRLAGGEETCAFNVGLEEWTGAGRLLVTE